MSAAYVSIRTLNGLTEVFLVCPTCGINTQYPAWRTANEDARQHNALTHPRRIDWAGR